jgi:hypothetical protein
LRPSPKTDSRPEPGPSEAKAPSGESLRAQIMRILWDRKSSETMIVGYWRYVPLVAVCFAALTGLTFFVLVPSIAGFVFGYLAIYSVCFAILAIVNYKIVRAMNAHFRREAALRPLLIGSVRQRSSQSPSVETKAVITRMERVDLEAVRRERPKNEMMSAMSALPIVGIAFGYAFLRSSMMAQAEHERNWGEFLSLYDGAGERPMKELPTKGERRTAIAEFAPCFVISLLFFPFLAYWYRAIDKRVERHLLEQWQTEDLLAKALQ